MSRYIDADALTYSHTKDGDVVVYPEAIAEAPSIDIVRCKDCKYYESDGGAVMFCKLTDMIMLDDGFCSYGEREDDE